LGGIATLGSRLKDRVDDLSRGTAGIEENHPGQERSEGRTPQTGTIDAGGNPGWRRFESRKDGLANRG